MSKINLLNKFVESFRLNGNQRAYLNLINGSFFVDEKYNSKDLSHFFANCTPQEKKLLKEIGFILNSPEIIYTKQYLAELKQKAENIIPNSIIFVLSFACNFSCPYCTPKNYDLKFTKDKTSTGNMFNVEKIFQTIKHRPFLLKGAKNQIGFYGGETFLNSRSRIETVNRLFAEIYQIKPKTIFIPTNGYELDKYFSIFKKADGTKTQVFLQITLDGAPAVHNLTRKTASGKNTFDKITKNIDYLLKNTKNVTFKIRTNISSYNSENLDQYINYVFKKHKNWINNPRVKFYFIPIFNENFSNLNKNTITDAALYKFLIGLNAKNIKNFKSHPLLDILINSFSGEVNLESTIRCKNIVFGPDGNIYTCNLCNKNSKIGNYINNSVNLKLLKKFWQGQKYNIPKCRQCKYVYLCDGGDRVAAINKYKTALAPMCNCYRRNFKLFYQLLFNPKLETKGQTNFLNDPCLVKKRT